jgi:hypothetical protein
MEFVPDQLVRVRLDAGGSDLKPGEIGRVVQVASGLVTVDFRAQRRALPPYVLEPFDPQPQA